MCLGNIKGFYWALFVLANSDIPISVAAEVMTVIKVIELSWVRD